MIFPSPPPTPPPFSDVSQSLDSLFSPDYFGFVMETKILRMLSTLLSN